MNYLGEGLNKLIPSPCICNSLSFTQLHSLSHGRVDSIPLLGEGRQLCER